MERETTGAASRPRKGRLAAISAALALLTLASFWGVLSNGFVNFDDPDYVVANGSVLRGLSGSGVAHAFTTTDAGNWHPLTWLSHMIDVELFGLRAGGHHATSLVLHAINVILLFLLLVRMTGAVWRPAFVAGLFAVHPLHVESVAWIAERKDVLSTFFWLLMILAWVRFTEHKTPGRYALVVAAFAAGLMSKPMLVTAPFLLMLLDVWPLKRAAAPVLWKEKLPLFAMSVVSSVVTVIAQGHRGAVQSLEGMAFPVRIANAAESYVRYLGKTVWPVGLACFYPHPGHARPGLAIGAAIVLTSVTVMAVKCARRVPYVTMGWGWFVLTLLPVIGLVQVGNQSMADRYSYFSLVGIFIAIAWGLADMGGRSRDVRIAVSAGCGVSLAVLAVLTRIQVGYWSGNEALFSHALAVTSDNWMAHSGLGGALADQGRMPEAIAEFEEAVRLRPSSARGHYNLGVALSQTGRIGEAGEQFEQSLSLDGNYVEAHYNLGKVKDAEGKPAEAVESYRKAIELDPTRAKAWTNLGIDLQQLGQSEKALAAFEQARRLDPSIPSLNAAMGRERRDAAKGLEEQNRWPEAREALEQVTRLTPDDADAWAYLALAYQHDHDFDKASGAYREAIRLNPSLVICRFNLGVLALKAGDTAGASEQSEALRGLDAKLAASLQALIDGRKGAGS